MKEFLKYYLIRLLLTILIVSVWFGLIFVCYHYFDLIGVVLGFVMIILACLLHYKKHNKI